VRALLDYFFALATPVLENPGERFAAITDPGTPLEQAAHERGFQRLWSAPADVGGRFSALTVFGTLPMAIMGIDTAEVLASARRMAANCATEVPVAANPAARLAGAMHQALAAGRDKLTLVASPALASFGAWAEQLVAESTGKHGKGVIPIVAEPAGPVAEYGDDRLFVSMRLQEEKDPEGRAHVDALEAAGHPVVRIVLADRHDIGGEFFRWEAAVALLGALMEINPFDQPDVQASKDRTAAILAGDERAAGGADRSPAAAGNGWTIFADLERDADLASRLRGPDMAGWLGAHLGRASVPEYVGIQAFVAPQRATHRALQRLRVLLRQRRGVATTLGWGPRFLHSTGQLHKGGPDSALFLQITADDKEDIEVPGAGYSFGQLARAQSLGDLAALQERGRRVVRIHVSDAVAGCQALFEAATQALE
jgi:transaldolase/glucose-6-phosphate isomerase